MIDTDDLIRAAIRELVAAAPSPAPLDDSARHAAPRPMERLVPVSMNERKSTPPPTPAALATVAAAVVVVGGIWYLTSDRSVADPVADQPPIATADVAPTTDVATAPTDPGSAATSTAVPTTTVRLYPPAVQRPSVISPIAPGDVELSDSEVLLLDRDRVVAVDVTAATARIVATAPEARRIVGVTDGAIVVEQCCDGELLVAGDDPVPVIATELDVETGETIGEPTEGWRFATMRPGGGRLVAVVGTDLVITSTTDGSGTLRTLLELERIDHEPVFGTVTDLGWTGDGANIVLIEELGDVVVVHRVGGSTGAHTDRAVVAPAASIAGVSFVGPGPSRSFAVQVHAAGDAADEVLFFDGTTLELLDRIELPAAVDRVRSGTDGSLVWTDGDVLTVRRPDGTRTDVPLP